MRILRLLIYEGTEEKINKTIKGSITGSRFLGNGLLLTAETIRESNSTIQLEISRIVQQHEISLQNLSK